MKYLKSPFIVKARLNPKTLLENSHSVIITGLNYQPPSDAQANRCDISGKIASYAIYLDYHKVLKEMMKALMSWLASQTDFPLEYRIFIDSGPVMEKDFAMQAGLGFIGKNSLLIHPEFGSYIVLGCVFTNLELQPDQLIQSDFCESCSNCIQACPTSCILDNRTIDARRCISYLTIEYRGIIPLELRSKIGVQVFGCDICQKVCPKNKIKSQNETVVWPKLINSEISLLQESMISKQEFSVKYKDSPLNRLPHETYLRNLIIAMGNLKADVFSERLAFFLNQHKSPIVRAHAAWALGNNRNSGMEKLLKSALNKENNLEVLNEIKLAISQSIS